MPCKVISSDSPGLILAFVKAYTKVIYILVTQCQASASGPKVLWYIALTFAKCLGRCLNTSGMCDYYMYNITCEFDIGLL